MTRHENYQTIAVLLLCIAFFVQIIVLLLPIGPVIKAAALLVYTIIVAFFGIKQYTTHRKRR